MKPLFIDHPWFHIITARTERDDVAYACAVSGVRKKTGYSRAWWLAMACIAVATLWVIL